MPQLAPPYAQPGESVCTNPYTALRDLLPAYRVACFANHSLPACSVLATIQ